MPNDRQLMDPSGRPPSAFEWVQGSTTVHGCTAIHVRGRHHLGSPFAGTGKCLRGEIEERHACQHFGGRVSIVKRLAGGRTSGGDSG